MGIFDFAKKDRVVDLSEKYNQISDSELDEGIEVGTLEERRKRLAKRIADMADKLDELSNNLYHLVQRVEVLEKKVRVTHPDN